MTATPRKPVMIGNLKKNWKFLYHAEIKLVNVFSVSVSYLHLQYICRAPLENSPLANKMPCWWHDKVWTLIYYSWYSRMFNCLFNCLCYTLYFHYMYINQCFVLCYQRNKLLFIIHIYWILTLTYFKPTTYL